MKTLSISYLLFFWLSLYAGPNQTDSLSPVLPEDSLPFTLKIELADFSLPVGLQAFASAIYDGKWMLLAGRTNGLHSFNNRGNNFPPSSQNHTVFVIDPSTGEAWSRSLVGSDLSQEQIDNLSTTAAEYLQKEEILYVVGGYGINTTTHQMETKANLAKIDIRKMMQWVIRGVSTPSACCSFISNPALQVAGGALFQSSGHPFLLMLGQNFAGRYTGGSNGIYTMQIRPFRLSEIDNTLSIVYKSQAHTVSSYRRRDLNIVPTIHNGEQNYTAFAGVFTLDTGVWTVPITIFPDGTSFEPNPEDKKTFKQAMNHYNCPTFGLYSAHTKEMYVVFPGGISYGFFDQGLFTTDSEFPFINQVTTIKIDQEYRYSQYLMREEYPSLLSTESNPGNQLLFGAEAQFFPADKVPLFSNGVLELDRITEPTIVGYIAGGIMSTLPNTSSASDSSSSPYVFTVTLIPKNR